jgi:hypothetical protein
VKRGLAPSRTYVVDGGQVSFGSINVHHFVALMASQFESIPAMM